MTRRNLNMVFYLCNKLKNEDRGSKLKKETEIIKSYCNLSLVLIVFEEYAP
jgi:hypothetical protein